MDINITSIDVQNFHISDFNVDTLSVCLFVFLCSWLIFVSVFVASAANYYRWNRPGSPRKGMLTTHLVDNERTV